MVTCSFNEEEIATLRTLILEVRKQLEETYEQIIADRSHADIDTFTEATQDARDQVRVLTRIEEEVNK